MRLNYESQLYPIDQEETVFSRHRNISIPETGKADWMVYSAKIPNLKAGENAGFETVTIPLWQLVQLVLKGSVWDDTDQVSETSIITDYENSKGKRKSRIYYVTW